MNVVQPLLDLQEIDGRIREFEKELKDIPARIAQEEERLQAAVSFVKEAGTALLTAKSRVEDLSAEVEKRQEKIKNLKKEQVNLSSNSEFRTFNIQIAALEGEIERFEQQMIDASDDTKGPERRVQEAEAKLAEEQGNVDGFVNELKARAEDVKKELAEAEAERATFVKNVPPRHLAYYDRMRTKRWPVVVPLQQPDCVCSGCHLVQPPSIGQMVRRNQDLVACQMCGRLLYQD